MCHVTGVLLLIPVNSGRPSDLHSLVILQIREDIGEFTIVDIGTILRQAYLILEKYQRWLVNSQMDVRSFNAVYYGISIRESGFGEV